MTNTQSERRNNEGEISGLQYIGICGLLRILPLVGLFLYMGFEGCNKKRHLERPLDPSNLERQIEIHRKQEQIRRMEQAELLYGEDIKNMNVGPQATSVNQSIKNYK